MNFFNGGEYVELKPSSCFNSIWMSAGDAQEWIYVDLGTKADFDKVILHWVNKAVQGKIQTSDDARSWKDAAPLPGGDSPTDEIAVKGKARYVRVLMERPKEKGSYMLSEIEVMGKGGLTARAVPQPAAEGNKYPSVGRQLEGPACFGSEGQWRRNRFCRFPDRRMDSGYGAGNRAEQLQEHRCPA